MLFCSRIVIFASKHFQKTWYRPVSNSPLTCAAISADALLASEILKEHDTGLEIKFEIPYRTWIVIFEALELDGGCIVDLIPWLGTKLLAALKADLPYVGIEHSSKRFDKIVSLLPSLLKQVMSDVELGPIVDDLLNSVDDLFSAIYDDAPPPSPPHSHSPSHSLHVSSNPPRAQKRMPRSVLEHRAAKRPRSDHGRDSLSFLSSDADVNLSSSGDGLVELDVPDYDMDHTEQSNDERSVVDEDEEL